MRTNLTLAMVCGIAAAGCAGHVEYARPRATPTASNVKTIDKPRDQVWSTSVPELGKQFFTINNLDKSSGLINVSYSGDPEQFVDCGMVKSYVMNARGERTYEFPAAKAKQWYETMENGQLRLIDRRMSLEGRVNLIFEEVDASRTKVTANTRYVLTRTQDVSAPPPDGRSARLTDVFTFNSGGNATVRNGNNEVECRPTGALEAQILSAVH